MAIMQTQLPTYVTFHTIEKPASETNRIVVLLDGSRQAERAIPQAISYALSQDAELILLHLYQSTAHAYRAEMMVAGQGEIFAESAIAARHYVEAEANKLRAQNLIVHPYAIEARITWEVVADFVETVGAGTVILNEVDRLHVLRFLFDDLADQLRSSTNATIITV